MLHKHVNLGISIGNFLIPYYGLMIVLGLMVAFSISYFQVKKYKLNFDDFILLSTFSAIFGLIGAKFLFIK